MIVTSFKHCWAKNVFDIKRPDRVVIVHSWKQVYIPLDIEACVGFQPSASECFDLRLNLVCRHCGVDYNDGLFGEKYQGL